MNEETQHFILMADDDGDDRLLAQDAFAECKLQDRVRFVCDGEELMDYLLHKGRFAEPGSSPRPAVVLLDLNMPRKDGRQALREIRSHPDLQRLPVIIFTTSRTDTDVGTLYDLGANSFVPKPVAFDALVNIMSTLTRYWFSIVELPPKNHARHG